MKKIFLMLAAVGTITFTSCIGKDSTADEDNTINDGMHTSETTLGTGSTRPSDIDAGDHEATIQPEIGADRNVNEQAVQRNAMGQTIHEGGIPGSADTSRTGATTGRNMNQNTGQPTNQTTNQNYNTDPNSRTR